MPSTLVPLLRGARRQSHRPAMSRLGLAARVVIVIVVGTLLFGGARRPFAPPAPTSPRSCSSSTSRPRSSRTRPTGNASPAALERIADRVDETSSALMAGDTTVSLVQFAAKAAVYQDCTDMKLLGDALAVAQFADCLRSVAGAYRKGLDPALEGKIGIDTNYVAAMEQAATHLPSNAVRPALILFTDGKHDVAGVPVSQVPVALDRLFGTRSPFALLPVGMGLEAKDRTALEAGLARMRIVRRDARLRQRGDVRLAAGRLRVGGRRPATPSRSRSRTPPARSPWRARRRPARAPPPAIAAVRGIKLTPRDGGIDVAWAPAVATTVAPPIVDYKVRCRAGDGDWIEFEGRRLARADDRRRRADQRDDLPLRGRRRRCDVGRPVDARQRRRSPRSGAPGRRASPRSRRSNQALRVSVPPADPASVTGFHYECSGDNGATWSDAIDVASAADPAATSSASSTAWPTSAGRSPRTPSAGATRQRSRTPCDRAGRPSSATRS